MIIYNLKLASEKGHYEIDPVELFRGYPPKGKPNKLGKHEALPSSNSQKTAKSEVLDLPLVDRNRVIAVKD